MTYDEKQLYAREVTWLCCRRTVFATAPYRGCLACGLMKAAARE
jgi:hypothetical protein